MPSGGNAVGGYSGTTTYDSGGRIGAGGTGSDTSIKDSGAQVRGTGGTHSMPESGADDAGGAGSGGVRPATGGTGTGGGGASAVGAGGTRPGTGGMGAAGMPPDAAPSRWCDARQALFCEDFDELSTVDEFLGSWTSVSTTGGTFSFDSVAGVPSPPHALRIRTTSASAVTAVAIHAMPAFTKAPSRLRLEFDVRIDAGDGVGVASGAMFAGILTGTRLSDGVIGIEIGTGPSLRGGYLEPNGAFKELPLASAFPTEGEWIGPYAVEADYSRDQSGKRTGCIQILSGGAPQLTQCAPLPASLVDPPFVSIALGVYGGGLGLTGNVQLEFDDVTFTAE
jgi:hypothetical protein